MNSSDREILKKLKDNNKIALTNLYNRYWKQLFLSSYSLLKDKELCEEIVQDVFIDLWKNRNTLNISISLQAYLNACSRYKVYAQFRKKKIIQIELLEDLKKRKDYSTPETEILYRELVTLINHAVGQLPKRCREVYKLSRHHHMSHKDIAEKLNISYKTVENHIGNALRTLRIAIGRTSIILIIYFIG